MKKIIFPFLLLFLLQYSSNGQRIAVNEIDKFNGLKYISTTDEPIFKSGGINVLKVSASVSSDATNKLYSITFIFRANDVLSTRKGDSAFLKSTTGKVLSFPYAGDYSLYTSDNTVLYQIRLTESDVRSLIDLKITDIRLSNSSYNRDYEIKDKYQSVIAGICRLILNPQ